MKDCKMMAINLITNYGKECYQQGRTDGIDELVRIVCKYYTMQERAGYCADTNNMIKQRISDFAEQLKENKK